MASIKGYIIDNPKQDAIQKERLDLDIKTLETFVNEMEKGNFEEGKQYTKEEIVVWIESVSSQMIDLKKYLHTKKQLISCNGIEHCSAAARAKFYVDAKHTLTKCTRKLEHIETALKRSPKVNPNPIHSHPVVFTDTIRSLNQFQTHFQSSENDFENLQITEVGELLEQLDPAVNDINKIRELFGLAKI